MQQPPTTINGLPKPDNPPKLEETPIVSTPETKTETFDAPKVSKKPVKVDIPVAKPYNNKENNMADVDTQMLSNQHSDIRFEQQEQSAEIRYDVGLGVNEVVKEGLKGDFNTVNAIKDSRFELASRVENSADRSDRNFASLADRFFTVSRDTADLRAQVIQAIDTTKMTTELNALKGIIEGQKNTQYLADKIGMEGDRTRALINELKYHDLNRTLVERNAELVEERESRRHWRHHAEQAQYQGQWAALQNQVQAFASQLQETRQGMVNFGSMNGVGQSSTSNNVR